MTTYTIRQLPTTERPRERLTRHGYCALSTAELLAIILGNGTRGASVLHLAQQLLSLFGSLEKLAEATIPELCQVKGIGPAKAVQLKAAFGLTMRMSRSEEKSRFRIDHPWHVYHLLKEPFAYANQEHFIIIMQDAKGYCIKHEIIAIGSLTETLVHPREVFYPAIRHKAVTLLLVHNHPSGDPTPSEEDIVLTKNLCELGTMMDIPVVDHIILAKEKFLSLREQKMNLFHFG